MASLSPKHKRLSPEAEKAFMEFCGIRTFLQRVLDNETQPDDDVDAFFARLHDEIPFYIAYRFFPELRNADATVDELLSEDRVPNAIFYDLRDIMQELMDEGLPTNPFPVDVWAELEDARQAQGRPAIYDTASEEGDMEATGPLGLVPPTGKWSNDDPTVTDEAVEDADVDDAELTKEISERLARSLLPAPEPQQTLDNDEQNEPAEPSKTRGTGTGLYDTDDEDALDSPNGQPPKMEIIGSGAAAVALTAVESPHEEPSEPHIPRSPSPLNTILLNSPPPSPHPSPAPPQSTLDPTVPAFFPPDPTRQPLEDEIQLLKGWSAPTHPPLPCKTTNPPLPPPEHLSALALQLAHVQHERSADHARVLALERHIQILHLERACVQLFATDTSQDVRRTAQGRAGAWARGSGIRDRFLAGLGRGVRVRGFSEVRGPERRAVVVDLTGEGEEAGRGGGGW
ncbi:Proline-rich protein 12 [Xylographa opegraphella]|nr:Proline-rich protein 12 [Xylographa opegraphella]